MVVVCVCSRGVSCLLLAQVGSCELNDFWMTWDLRSADSGPVYTNLSKCLMPGYGRRLTQVRTPAAVRSISAQISYAL